MSPCSARHKSNPVESVSFKSTGYDEASRTLEVEYKDGRIYQFHDVPKEVAEEFRAADPLGSYFNRRIKGMYRYDRVDGL